MLDAIRLYLSWVAAVVSEAADAVAHHAERASTALDPGTFGPDDFAAAAAIIGRAPKEPVVP